MIKYITSRPLWFNILVALGAVIILFLIFMFSLNLITKHGDSKTVPAITMKNIREVEKILDEKGFDLVIQDSVYYDSIPPGAVIKQVPEADAVVKENRNVYVIINRFVAPDVALPNVIGYTLRNAQFTLEKAGLRLGDTTSEINWAKNSVLRALYNGNPISAGDKVKQGSRIDLVIARGTGLEDMNVPDLIGKTLGEARVALEAYGLELGSVVPIDLGSNDNAYVYKQDPAPRTADGIRIRIRQGQSMDLWLQTEKPVTDSLNQQAPQPPQ